MKTPAVLLLEDGTLFNGFSFGYAGEAAGESCFNTALSGYQEILTDPSYAGQIVAMTAPMIGNYGTNAADMESAAPRLSGFVVREYSRVYANWRAETSLAEFLLKHKIPGIEGVDTRKLTRHIRDKGAMRCIISSTDPDKNSLLAKVKASPEMTGRDLASKVTGKKALVYSRNQKYKVIAYDFGCKQNILRLLTQAGCGVTVVPAGTPAARVLAEQPDGVFLSNGPGDPAAVTYAIENTRTLIASGTPVFGICLGHQIIALALGARTFKLKYGHRGGNQPVMDLTTRRVEITAQNHGFAVDPASLQGLPVEITHLNLNDRTVEGLAHKTRPVFGVQYHPEASPGPHDAAYLFQRFVGLMRCAKITKMTPQ
ncbi:MAG: glutamine-hydrolyzing carbamoyl-phosphate synthase small subunit [Candidatus Margulisbacteria bacterium]|jgi:carbamoyl-phosphate synthase small subunit|nr:glutamine-hydrolyzing carbamoyl-phosphate synthase small subunit [Candidatus Margulisiibacteriota bacterium]